MKRFAKNITIYIVIFALVLGGAMLYKGKLGASNKKVKYSTMVQYFAQGKVKSVNVCPDSVWITSFSKMQTAFKWGMMTRTYPISGAQEAISCERITWQIGVFR